MQNTDSGTWQAYRDALFRFILNRVSDESAAEDIVQDVLLKAYMRQGDLRNPASLRAWLYQITRNRIVDHYRSQKPSHQLPDDLAREDGRSDGRDAQRELATCLLPLLEELPESYRQALRLADFEGMKQRDVAALTGLSVSGAKSRVQRARKMLKEVLLQCCRIELDRGGRPIDYEVGGDCGDCCDQPEPRGTP